MVADFRLDVGANWDVITCAYFSCASYFDVTVGTDLEEAHKHEESREIDAVEHGANVSGSVVQIVPPSPSGVFGLVELRRAIENCVQALPLSNVVGVIRLFGWVFGGIANSDAEVSFREVVPVAQRKVVRAPLGVGLCPFSGVNGFLSEASFICWCAFIVIEGVVACRKQVVE